MIPFLLVFLCFHHPSESAENGNVPTECQQPIKCLNSTTLSFCGMINGVEQNIGQTYLCPTGYECSIQNKFQPCVFKPPECSAVGAGKFAAAKCNEYYECSSTLWWWNQSLNTCPQDQAFSIASKQCVSITETDCRI
ncbi:hypothetical protein WA026_002244 [Henosepilachna vigintioctopunctata]|uniref:Chitin-binding type-2 domain-containing protein n=1 Tax=Henosepilachna vigintioctopunctata TaxID=420089 RepID=A0AAW1U088_9CUCU